MLKANALGKKLIFVLPTVLFIGVFLAIASSPRVSCAFAATITCGDPTKTGTVTVVVVVTDVDGSNERTITWDAAIDATDNDNVKAEKIRAAFPGDADIRVWGNANVVTVSSDNRKIRKIGVANDSTNESVAAIIYKTQNPSVYRRVIGTFSAEGVSVGGGYVEITYQDHTERVNTTIGMTAADIEDALVSQFNADGINAYISNEDPAPGVVTDGRYLYFEESTHNMVTDITDVGIENDISMVINAEDIPTLSSWGMIVLVLVLVGLSLTVIQRRRRISLKS